MPDVKPPRAPWGNFPDVILHAGETAVKKHPAYVAAKAGDGRAAIELVQATVSDLAVGTLASLLRCFA